MIDSQNEQLTGRPPDGDMKAESNGEGRLPALRPAPSVADGAVADGGVADGGKPRRRWPWFLGAIAALVSGILIYWQPWVAGPVDVATELAELAPVTRVLAVNGRIAAVNSVDIRALVGGSLIALPVAEGAGVGAGDVLARIDSAAQHAVLRQAIAGMDAALVAQAQAQANLSRAEALGANVPRTTLDTAATALQAAAQEVARATALVEQAQIQLANYTIQAPISGTVLALHVNAGEIIAPSTLLMTLADLSRVTVETDVDEAYATQITTGLPAVLRLAGETATRDGKVQFVSQTVDAATGGLSVKLGFLTDVTAPVGLTVTANIVVDQRAAALTVPRSAIVTTDTGTAVLVVVAGVAESRSVTVLDWPAARLIVTEGLMPGDIVIADATGITAGQAVRGGQP